MKRSFLLALCLSAAAAFAGVYDIADFTAKDAVMSDNQVFAANGGQPLSTASVEEASAVPAGNIVLRQKFAQESGLNAYQLYIGSVGDVSSMTALSVPTGTSYSDVVKAKLYARRGMKPGDDAEKVYFDGKFVYLPGATSAVAFVNGVQIDLKNEAPATQSAAAPQQECDEFDVSCDEDIIAMKKNKNVDVSGDLNQSNSYADSRDYSASAAAQDVKDRFGIADEVRFWSAVALSAVAAGSAVVGVLQHMKSSEANKAYKDLEKVANTVEGKIKEACGTVNNPDKCVAFFKTTTADKAFMFDNWNYVNIQQRMKVNKDTKDSYAMGRNIWFGVTALSLTTAIVLFAW
ncbi:MULTISPECIES: hypothetical protein [unclassified Fibrobacter]|uniref:hypothetical protein n=1 Tax=unclassified Fibrobacter TaxID=2634177 RepID=UPI00091C800E|nr:MULTISPECIES: hypothetical protein [unclassified Fibrobacter]SHK22847.1 hypothetical protein SAMN05720759_101232 [Fibrobacter sp. UWB12]SIO13877.1 hypothetical protein SAMN05720758_1616 [Fibrobacter sp. UWB11]